LRPELSNQTGLSNTRRSAAETLDQLRIPNSRLVFRPANGCAVSGHEDRRPTVARRGSKMVLWPYLEFCAENAPPKNRGARPWSWLSGGCTVAYQNRPQQTTISHIVVGGRRQVAVSDVSYSGIWQGGQRKPASLTNLQDL
jgi:hypothetical protein